MQTINFWPVLVASIVSFGIGAIWYSPFLFGNKWKALVNIDEESEEQNRENGSLRYYVIHFIATIVTFSVFAFFVSAFSANTWVDGAFLGLLAWIGFTATEAVGTLIWEKKPFKLVLINTSATLISLLVGGAIIGGWM